MHRAFCTVCPWQIPDTHQKFVYNFASCKFECFFKQLSPLLFCFGMMKIKPILDDLLDWLQARGLLAGAYFIERVGAADERALSGEAMLALRGTKVSYLSLLIVKNPHRVRGERIKGCLKK